MGKGGDFERIVSKAFTKWLTGSEKPYKYWRMPGSGGLATIHEECTDLSGDIRALSTESEFLTERFSIECKTGYPSTSFWQHFKQVKNFNIKEFWRQCINDANKGGKQPMLIYRKKGRQEIIGICKTDKELLEGLSDGLAALSYLTLRFEFDDLPQVTLYNFKEFLKMVSPEMIKQLE